MAVPSAEDADTGGGNDQTTNGNSNNGGVDGSGGSGEGDGGGGQGQHQHQQRQHRQLRRVSARESIAQLRGRGVISVGASVELVEKMSAKHTPRRPLQILRNSHPQSPTNGSGNNSNSSKMKALHDRDNDDVQEMRLTEYQTYITSLVEDLDWAFSELMGSNGNNNGNEHQVNPPRPPVAQIEEWALFLHEILTQESRKFHDVVHVYEISAGSSPLQFLSAAFRDVVHHHVTCGSDGVLGAGAGCKEQAGGSSSSSSKVGNVVEGAVIVDVQSSEGDGDDGKGSRVSVRLDPRLLDDERDRLVADVFGFAPDTAIESHSGDGLYKVVDLFLSAVCASRVLRDHLDLRHVAQVAACLEATIPFRRDGGDSGSSDNHEKTPAESLYDRLVACNARYDLRMSEEEIVETVQQGVDLRNRTVGNMVTDNIADFLDHTWNLLSERNASLRRNSLHDLAEYYSAVRSMLKIMEDKRLDSVYGEFRGCPVWMDVARFEEVLSTNLSKAVLYLRARLLAVATVTALAELTGGADAPKSFFFGDLPTPHRASVRLGDGLPLRDELSSRWQEGQNQEEPSPSDEYSAEVFELLRGNRMSDTGFDTRQAPLAAYMFQEMGGHGAALERYGQLYACPMTAESAMALLRELPLDLVQTVGREVGQIAISRRRAIGRLLKELETPSAANASAARGS